MGAMKSKYTRNDIVPPPCEFANGGSSWAPLATELGRVAIPGPAAPPNFGTKPRRMANAPRRSKCRDGERKRAAASPPRGACWPLRFPPALPPPLQRREGAALPPLPPPPRRRAGAPPPPTPPRHQLNAKTRSLRAHKPASPLPAAPPLPSRPLAPTPTPTALPAPCAQLRASLLLAPPTPAAWTGPSLLPYPPSAPCAPLPAAHECARCSPPAPPLPAAPLRWRREASAPAEMASGEHQVRAARRLPKLPHRKECF